MRSATLLNLRSLKGAQLVSPSAVTQFRPGSQALQASAGRPSQWAISCSRRGDSARGHQAAARPSREQPTSPGKTLRVAQRSCCSAVRSRVMAGRGADASAERAPAAGDEEDPLVQYVVLRRDLWTDLGWPLGSIVAQACHASTAALWQSRDSDATERYCAAGRLDHMRKVVLEIKGQAQLRTLAEKLAEVGVAHKLWVEQPEGIPTCLATAPAHKSAVGSHFKKLKLCKGL